VIFEEIEKAICQRLRALPPAARANSSTSYVSPTSTEPTASASSGGHPETRAFGELLIDLEEVKAARAVVFGLLAEMERKGSAAPLLAL
jgi:hypothetical protein